MNQSQWEMIEAGGRTAQSFGVNRLMGQVYMLLYLTENPLSLDELSQEIGVSKASASITCRQLESWGALRKVWKRGDRKDYYEAETNLSSIVHQALFGSLEKKLESARTQIQRSLNLLAIDNVLTFITTVMDCDCWGVRSFPRT